MARYKKYYGKKKIIAEPEEIKNYNDMKLLKREDLNLFIPEGFTFKRQPWLHQLSAFVACILNDGFLCALDLGTGKTQVSIDVCRYHEFKAGRRIRVLVVCLKSAIENWDNEIRINSNMKSTMLKGTSQEKRDMLKGDGFFIIGFESLTRMVTDKHTYMTRKDTLKTELVIIKEYMEVINKFKFDAIVIDESHKIKNPQGLIFNIIKKIIKGVKYRVLLTGTPFGNNLLDIWGQYYIVDKGVTFGGNITQYKNMYFKDTGYWGPEWTVTKTGEETIRKKLFNNAIRYEEGEVQELPDKVFRILSYELSNQQRRAYDKAFNAGEFNGKQIANKALAFRQICSTIEDNGKLDVLKDTLEIIVEKSKIVIFTFFKESIKLISKMLKTLKIKHVILDGSTKNAGEVISDFQNNDACRVIVANIKSGGASINLFVGNYTFYYDIPDSVIDYKQSIKRTHRAGQKQKCFYYSLVGKGTIEVTMQKNLEKGVNAFDSIIDGKTFISALKGE